jgi:hypothetical protein
MQTVRADGLKSESVLLLVAGAALYMKEKTSSTSSELLETDTCYVCSA